MIEFKIKISAELSRARGSTSAPRKAGLVGSESAGRQLRAGSDGQTLPNSLGQREGALLPPHRQAKGAFAALFWGPNWGGPVGWRWASFGGRLAERRSGSRGGAAEEERGRPFVFACAQLIDRPNWKGLSFLFSSLSLFATAHCWPQVASTDQRPLLDPIQCRLAH